MDKIEVSQRAREAAADLLRAIYHKHGKGVVFQVSQPESPSMLNGERDNGVLAQAFARFERDILATRTDATPVAWMPIDSAPMDEQILAAIKVNHKNGQSWWERHIIVIDSETGTISDMDFHHGWEVQEYTFWQPLPAAPDATNTHPPATDVAALVDAAKAFMDRVENYMAGLIRASGTPQYRNLRQALAPFTKGQP